VVHPDQADDRSDRRPTVAVLGDSITFESETELRVALEAGTVVDLTAVVGRPGKTFAELLADAEQIATTGPDLVVINLGTNDALKSVPIGDTRLALDALYAALPDALIVAVAVTTRFSDSPFDVRAQAINDRLRAGCRDRARPVAVVAWDEIVAADDANRADSPAHDPILSDGLHPTPRGRARLADAIAVAVAGAMRAIPR